MLEQFVQKAKESRGVLLNIHTVYYFKGFQCIFYFTNKEREPPEGRLPSGHDEGLRTQEMALAWRFSLDTLV